MFIYWQILVRIGNSEIPYPLGFFLTCYNLPLQRTGFAGPYKELGLRAHTEPSLHGLDIAHGKRKYAHAGWSRHHHVTQYRLYFTEAQTLWGPDESSDPRENVVSIMLCFHKS